MKKIVFSLLLLSGLNAGQLPSRELQELLSQEMSYIKGGMDEMLFAIISNDYETVSKIAHSIEHSYVFKDQILEKQKQEIKQKFPTKFFEYDMEFHETAQSVADFADFEDRSNVLKSYSSMVNQCVRCHESFATFRFEKFQK